MHKRFIQSVAKVRNRINTEQADTFMRARYPMNNYTVVIALACSLALPGCQSLSFRDIQSLPPTAALPQVRTQGEVQLRYCYKPTGVQTYTITTLASYPYRPDEHGILHSLDLHEHQGDDAIHVDDGLI